MGMPATAYARTRMRMGGARVAVPAPATAGGKKAEKEDALSDTFRPRPKRTCTPHMHSDRSAPSRVPHLVLADATAPAQIRALAQILDWHVAAYDGASAACWALTRLGLVLCCVDGRAGFWIVFGAQTGARGGGGSRQRGRQRRWAAGVLACTIYILYLYAP
ncbi:hypothetical protein DFH07DRAFT_862179 [Mycena maculata]|uniref:Uncharacterized protein n=1 Tax=Mycena maculata TaxID=230809 RepID=A0AAD7HAT8_9AGAR|nr:hypothetical protein DFH07DRAFT_862179 [Mycena maculata]